MTRDGRGGIKWVHGDRIFQNRNSTGDPVLQDDNCHTWASHLTSPAGKTMVITGRNEERKFTLDELLNRLDYFMLPLIGRLRRNQRPRGGKTIVYLPDNHSNQPDWHPDGVTKTDEFCDMFVDVVRVHGTHVTKAPGFSRQLERDSKSRVLITVNNLKMRAK